jgi:hypothetical protein
MVQPDRSLDAFTTGITIRCPACGVRIPAPHVDSVDNNCLSITLDMSLVHEHVRMHATCTCEWAESTVAVLDTDCPFHA